jgi:quercetin dioxygenase-like cupin family protein
LALATFAPGGVTPKHTHPGEEFLYLLEGRVRLEIDGQAPRDLQPGDAVIIPPGTPHLARNLGPGPAKIVSTYFLEKGRPLASPVAK